MVDVDSHGAAYLCALSWEGLSRVGCEGQPLPDLHVWSSCEHWAVRRWISVAIRLASAAVLASAAEGRRLYIGNLAYATTEAELKQFFSGYDV